jgi:hypothetical protein
MLPPQPVVQLDYILHLYYVDVIVTPPLGPHNLALWRDGPLEAESIRQPILRYKGGALNRSVSSGKFQTVVLIYHAHHDSRISAELNCLLKLSVFHRYRHQ